MKAKPRITSLDEYYGALIDLASWLQRDGCLDDSYRLARLMHTAWTTSSELLGELALALGQMRGKYSGELDGEIAACLDFAANHRKILRLDS